MARLSCLKLHEKGKEHAELAFMARREGKRRVFLRESRKALDYERTAAFNLKPWKRNEPSRSVLLRSAATLAIDCGESAEAWRLIASAFAGFPPAGVKEELLDLVAKLATRD